MIIQYDRLEQKLKDLPADIDPDFHGRCIHFLRGGDRRRYGILLYGLVRSLRPGCVVDVGTARGYSAVVMARALEDAGIEGRVYTIDTIDNETRRDWHAPKWGKLDPAAGKLLSRWDLLEPFRELVDRRIVFLTGRSVDMIPKIEWQIGLAFLDASPDYCDVSLDARLLLERGMPGMCLVFDAVDPTDEFEIVPTWLSRILTGEHSPSRRPSVLLGRAVHRFIRRRLPPQLGVNVPRAGYEGLVYKRSRCPGVTKAVAELARLAETVEIVPIDDVTETWKRDDYGVAILTFSVTRHEPLAAVQNW